MPGLVTGITIAQGVEYVLTICVEYSWPGRSRVICCIDDRSVSYWSCDLVDLHPDLSCVTQVVLFSWSVCVFHPAHVWVWIAWGRFQFLCTDSWSSMVTLISPQSTVLLLNLFQQLFSISMFLRLFKVSLLNSCIFLSPSSYACRYNCSLVL